MTMERPMSKITDDWMQYVEYIETKIKIYETDGMRGSYFALNAKINELNEIIREANIKLYDKDDKSFERFWKIATEIRELHSNVDWLKTKLGYNGSEDEKSEITKKIPIIEKLSDYHKNDKKNT